MTSPFDGSFCDFTQLNTGLPRQNHKRKKKIRENPRRQFQAPQYLGKILEKTRVAIDAQLEDSSLHHLLIRNRATSPPETNPTVLVRGVRVAAFRRVGDCPGELPLHSPYPRPQTQLN